MLIPGDGRPLRPRGHRGGAKAVAVAQCLYTGAGGSGPREWVARTSLRPARAALMAASLQIADSSCLGFSVSRLGFSFVEYRA